MSNPETQPLISIGKAMRILEISRPTIIAWEKNGKLTPAFTNDQGHRYYNPLDVEKVKNNRT